MKVYTKKGDKGKTSLLGGKRVEKSHKQIEAYGTIDELNSFIGLLSEYPELERKQPLLRNIQNLLFQIGSILAIEPGKSFDYIKNVVPADIEQLESEIDEMEKGLPALKNFILPGGSQAVAQTHICRTICRRAERRVIALKNKQSHGLILQYLNRLSDYFFVLGRRVAFDSGVSEVEWKSRD